MAKWNLDPSHSKVQFKVKHMVISTVTGNFDNFEAMAESNSDDFSDAKFEFAAHVNTINTKNTDRDNHLKSDDFFAAEKFPEMKFESTSGIQNGKVEGTLEIRGEKKPITLNADFGGVITDPWGLTRAGFEFSGDINRKDFGLNYKTLHQNGSAPISKEIKFIANLEFTH